MAKKSTGILVGIALALALGVAIFELGPRRQQQETVEAQNQLIDIEADAIASLTLSGEGKTFQLDRVDEVWQLEQPVQTQAEDITVSNLVNAIASIDAQTTLTEGNLAEFGLDTPTQTVEFATAEGDRYTLKLGSDTFDRSGTYAQLNDGDIAIVDATLKTRLQPELFSLRSKTLVAASQSDIQSLKIQTSDDTSDLELTAEGNQWTISQPRALAADPGAISTLFSQLTFVQATDFFDTLNPDLATYGLDRPVVEFSAQLKSGEPATLAIGRSEDGTLYARSSHQAAISQQDPIVAIAPTSLDAIPTDLFALRDKSLGNITPTLIGKVEIDSPNPDLKRTLTRIESDSEDTAAEDTWAVAGQGDREVSLAAIFEPITTARAAAFVTEDDAAAIAALNAPKFALTFFPAEGIEAEVVELTFAAAGDRLLVRSSDRADVIAIDPTLLEGIETAIAALKPLTNRQPDN